MSRIALILTLFVAPLASPRAPAADSLSTPAECCCCAADACHCGCETPSEPASPGGRGPTSARFCGCDDTPWSLPAPTTTLPERPQLAGLLAQPATITLDGTPHQRFAGHLPHGPPAALALLRTIILLN